MKWSATSDIEILPSKKALALSKIEYARPALFLYGEI